jgi:hypothetical protein
VLAGEREHPRSPRRELGQLFALLVGAFKRCVMESDLGFKFAAAVAVPPVEMP